MLPNPPPPPLLTSGGMGSKLEGSPDAMATMYCWFDVTGPASRLRLMQRHAPWHIPVAPEPDIRYVDFLEQK